MAMRGVDQQRIESITSQSDVRSDAVVRGSSDFSDVHFGQRHVGGSGSNRVAQPQQQANVDPSLRRRAVPRAQVAGGVTGGILGAAGGAVGGAVLGTMIMPGVGTIVGGIIGGLAGGNVLGGIAARIGGWFAGGSRQDKVDLGINHLLDNGRINQNEARQLKQMDQSQLRDLVKVSKGKTGITNRNERYAVRRSLLQIAAKHGLPYAQQVKANLLALPKPQNDQQTSQASIAARSIATLETHLEPPAGDPNFAAVRNDPNQLRDYKTFMRQGIITKSAQVGRPPNGHELTVIKLGAGAHAEANALKTARRQLVDNASTNNVFDQQNHPWLAQKFEQWARTANHTGENFDAMNAINDLVAKNGNNFSQGLNDVVTKLDDENLNINPFSRNQLKKAITKNKDENTIKRHLQNCEIDLRTTYTAFDISNFQRWMQTQPELQ
jgi:hypothetical protein